MRKQRPRRQGAAKGPVDASSGLEPKTIRFHHGIWEQVEARAGHLNPTEWLRAEIYEKILGLQPSDVERLRAA